MTILSVFLLGLITFLYRYSFVSTRGRKLAEKIPQDFLSLLAPATFTAIVVNSLLASQSNPIQFRQKTVVLILMSFIAYMTKSMIVTVVIGLGMLYALQYYLS